MRTATSKEINAKKLEELCLEHGGSQSISLELGYSANFLGKAIRRGTLTPSTIKCLCQMYNLPADYFDPMTEPVQITMELDNTEGYALHLKVWDDGKLRFGITHNGNQVGNAYAKCKDDSEMAFVQAINAATYFIIKNMEQEELAKE